MQFEPEPIGVHAMTQGTHVIYGHFFPTRVALLAVAAVAVGRVKALFAPRARIDPLLLGLASLGLFEMDRQVALGAESIAANVATMTGGGRRFTHAQTSGMPRSLQVAILALSLLKPLKGNTTQNLSPFLTTRSKSRLARQCTYHVWPS